MKKSIFIIFISCLSLLSCEKIIEVDLGENIERLVVEANITNNPKPYFVKLTRSINFYKSSNYPVVANAVVSITDNMGQSDVLTYTSNGIYVTNNLQGIEGRTYSLNIAVDGKTYTAQSTMPTKVNLDNLKISVFKFGDEDEISIIPIYTDPMAIGNNYRFIQKVNGKLDKSYYLFNDNLNNGKQNQRPIANRDPDHELKKGDLVEIEMRCVPKSTYNYFYALSRQDNGTTPVNPPNNISGGALGIFSAHTSQTKTITIP